MFHPSSAHWAYGSGTDAHAERARQEMMSTLTIRVSSLRACSACKSVFLFLNVHFVYPQRARQELMRALSIRVRSGTSACTEHARQVPIHAQSTVPSKHAEHTHQKLIRTLNIRVRKWCVCWLYASGTDARPEHTRKHKNSKFEMIPSTHAEHARKELMSTLTRRSACASEIKWCLIPPKIKVTSLYLAPKLLIQKDFMV